MTAPDLIERLRGHGTRPFLLSSHRTCDYSELVDLVAQARRALKNAGVQAGSIVSLIGEYQPEDIALFVALLDRRCIAVLIPHGTDRERCEETAGCEIAVTGVGSELRVRRLGRSGDHPLIRELRDRGRAGFVIFSSGSTGTPRAILHELDRFLTKFASARKALRTVAFLLLDHIAGLDTLFYTISAGGSLVVPADRSARAVCDAIQRHSAQVLPTSPTFLRLLRLSGAWRRFDLSSLEIITYGSEPMDEGGLAWLDQTFPNVSLEQKYGTSEFGSPRSRSRGRDSLWIRLKSDELEVRVVEGLLWVRSPCAMLGYLNAPSPFDEQGWLCTGDEAIVEGEWIRVLGRRSELILVGGWKVHPTEVEAVLLEHETVEQALVFGEPHPLMGQIVCAEVLLRPGTGAEREALRALRRHCRDRLAPHAVPIRLVATRLPLVNQRSKKIRRRRADRLGT